MDSFALSFTWGIAALIAIMSTASVSGGHINPAVTIASAVLGNHSWKKVPHYVAGQLIGSFAAAILIHVTYYDALQAYDGGMRITASHQDATGQIFTTYPAIFVSLTGAVIDQVVGTAILMYAFLSITDKERNAIPAFVQPIYMFFTVTGISMAFGLNCMASINPARDLSPRIYSAIAGYGLSPFTLPLNGSYWWAATIVAPVAGACVGGVVYRVFVDQQNLRRNSFYHVRKVQEMRDLPSHHHHQHRDAAAERTATHRQASSYSLSQSQPSLSQVLPTHKQVHHQHHMQTREA
jgi:MIP family channel proteins